MNPTVTAALIGVVGVIVGALASFWIQSRRLPSDIRLTEAQVEKIQHETSAMLIKELSDEVGRLKVKVFELEEQVKKLSATAAEAERFRLAVIHIGEKRDQDRKVARDMAVNLVGIIDHLLSCIEDPSRAKDIDRPAITQLIKRILDNYPVEQFVMV